MVFLGNSNPAWCVGICNRQVPAVGSERRQIDNWLQTENRHNSIRVDQVYDLDILFLSIQILHWHRKHDQPLFPSLSGK